MKLTQRKLLGLAALVLIAALICFLTLRSRDEVTGQLVDWETGATATNLTVSYNETVSIPVIGLITALPDSWRFRMVTGQVSAAQGTFRVRRIKKWSSLVSGYYQFYSAEALVGPTIDLDDAVVGWTIYTKEGFKQQIYSLTAQGIQMKDVPRSGKVTLEVAGTSRRR